MEYEQQKMVKKGINNFKITIIGRGKIETLPEEITPIKDNTEQESTKDNEEVALVNKEEINE